MAKFVLAGKTDCPHYAKAELLADSLQRSLPNFRIHKISILPQEWKEWLEATCRRNDWKHEQSPLVWRELVDQGGKGMLLGGFSDFLEHCQDYYSITSDMATDIMLRVASENLETKMNFIVEEQHRVSLIKPLHIWLSSALSPTCHFLIPNLLSAEVFPNTSTISLHLLDPEGNEERLQWLRMETENLALPLLHQVSIHTDLEQAFQEADVILLLDEWWSDDSDKEDEEEMKKKKVKGISDRYREYGRLIDTRANKEVKVIVSGDSFVNLRCSLLLDNARSIDSDQFVSVATQLENEAKAVIAKKLKVKTSDIKNVIVWGNISGSFYIDLQIAKVFNYDGAIKGPAFFSQPAKNILQERKWLETDFQDLVRRQRAAVASKSCRAAAMSLANGILAVLKAWNGICSPDEVFSMGVLCPGDYNLPDGIVLSIPVTFTDGKWSVLSDVTVGDELKERLQLFASELMQEKELGSENCTIVTNKEDTCILTTQTET
ncbi:putative malate dehydrogenase 1B [Cottoperca gobio]|uniref:Malate dehydrogenase 1B n=1 Tax=Cottoperca gobio TaxID=56716 RepID=A0A6J2R569_COTGO|nr:putative malate dehydrogenase 1B [Cottoperca gobio]